jgi:hypothetical protein
MDVGNPPGVQLMEEEVRQLGGELDERSGRKLGVGRS